MQAPDLCVALLPLEIKWGDKAANIDSLAEAAARTSPYTDLLILPETFSTGFPAGMPLEEVMEMAEPDNGPTISYVKELAKARNCALAGSFVGIQDGKPVNRAFFAEPGGEIAFSNKRHLFTMAGEHKIFSPGQRRLHVRFRGWNIALAVCYDVRFPVWCRNVDNSYDLLIAVANWPSVRSGAWNALLPARAIENEAYVCAVDCRGTDTSGLLYDGSSAIIDFKGNTVARAQDDMPIAEATLSLDKLRAFREKFPAWRDADKFCLL